MSANAPGLRAAALAALASRDQRQLDELFGRRRDDLRAAYPGWLAELGALLDGDARTTAEASLLQLTDLAGAGLRRDDPSLAEQLEARPEPLPRWGAAVERAATRVGRRDYAGLIDSLTDLLIDVHALDGLCARHWLPRTHGLLGQALFHTGQVERAEPPTRRALELANDAGDGAAIVAYLGNLYEIQRWLRRAEPAAQIADYLAECFDMIGEANDTRDEATRWRQQAARVRAGEPVVRVVALLGDDYHPVEIDDIPHLPAEMVRYILVRNRPSLGGTTAAIDAGRDAGRGGDLQAALDHFARAAEIDPHDPQPHFETARTLALLERYDDATRAYEKVEELAPGWYHVRAQLWLCRHLAARELEPSTLFILCSLEDERKPPEARLALADRQLEREPLMPHLHYHRGLLLRELGREEDALGAFGRGAELASEPDIKSSLMWELSLLVGLSSPSRRRILLERIINLRGANLLALAQARTTLRFMTR